jgi:hypothetical protein
LLAAIWTLSGTPALLPAQPAGAAVDIGIGIIEGQVARVDLSKGQLFVKVEGRRELLVVVDESATRLSRQGRTTRLVDVRPGEKVSVSCESDAGRCRARFVKLGAWKLPGPEVKKGAE